MENEKPILQVLKTRPPAQPPPSSENYVSKETQQWIEDAKYTAIRDLESETNSKIATLSTPLYQTNHKQKQYLSIPVPKMKTKSYHALDSTYSTSNYKDNETICWRHDGLKWIPPGLDATINSSQGQHANMFEEEISNKWDTLVGNDKISRLTELMLLQLLECN